MLVIKNMMFECIIESYLCRSNVQSGVRFPYVWLWSARCFI